MGRAHEVYGHASQVFLAKDHGTGAGGEWKGRGVQEEVLKEPF